MTMRLHTLLGCAAAALGLAIAAHSLDAYSLLSHRWSSDRIPVVLQLDAAAEGAESPTAWNRCAEESLATWNAVLAPSAVRLVAGGAMVARPASFDGVNSVAFTPNVFGVPFGRSVLSLTSSLARVRADVDETLESDVLVNAAQGFDCDGGVAADVHDLRPILTHALGHVLGLDHPDAARQEGPMLMSAEVTDVDGPQHSDIQGALTVAGVDTVGIPFPPRNETLVFYQSLEGEYRDTLQRDQDNEGFVDAEGSAVWFPEWLRYVLNACSAEEATTRVLMQIRGEGIQPVCGEVAEGTIQFPPRNQSLDFLQALDNFYRDELNRSVELSYVDLEGKAVWLSEYLRFRVTGSSDAAARNQVLQQIRAAAPPVPQPEAAACAPVRYTITDLGLVLSATQVGQTDPLAPVANPTSLLLNDGRVRLFFTNAGEGIASAISEDGISFTYEGIRISGPEAFSQGAPTGPSRVFRMPDGNIRIYIGSSESGVSSWMSTDEGQTWTLDTGERITQAQADMDAIQKLSIVTLSDGSYRGYFGPAPQSNPDMTPTMEGPPDHWLRSATSTDLLNWTVEDGVLIGPGAPTLTASVREVEPLLRSDGCLTLFYQLNKPRDAGITDFEGVAVVGYSTSHDGRTFTEQFPLITTRDPAGPDVIRLLDGSYLLYHDSTTDSSEYGHGIRVTRLNFTTAE
ncbi:MAG: hypothetical protein CL441_06240 [Acidimicrobiaceae bacterium]|nr:hypothetical protein [Acidimicrobiaceae bacterium]